VGSAIAVPVHLPGPGQVTQSVIARVNRQGLVFVCGDRERRSAPGRLTASCDLSDTALRRLARDPLELAIRIGVALAGGERQTFTRRLTLPRR